MLTYAPVAQHHRTQSREEPGVEGTQGGQEKICRQYEGQRGLETRAGAGGTVRVPGRNSAEGSQGEEQQHRLT